MINIHDKQQNRVRTRSSATATNYVSKILSTVETSCTINPQQIAVTKLEVYSWLTCSKQPRLVHCRIGVVSMFDRRRRRRILLTTRSTCRGAVFKVRSLRQSPKGKDPNFWKYPNFLITQCDGIDGRKPQLQNKLDSSSLFNTIPSLIQ